MKKQIVIIHGGDTFETYSEYIASLKGTVIDSLASIMKVGWKDSLQEKLGPKYEVILPKMPNKANAKYLEWKIWFDKIVPLLDTRVILIGHSLGGIFLAKYLAENTIRNEIVATILIASPHSELASHYSLADFVLPKDAHRFQQQAKKIFIYHSKDDYVVPFDSLQKYKEMLPTATVHVFENRGHFNQETFDELVSLLKTL